MFCCCFPRKQKKKQPESPTSSKRKRRWNIWRKNPKAKDDIDPVPEAPQVSQEEVEVVEEVAVLDEEQDVASEEEDSGSDASLVSPAEEEVEEVSVLAEEHLHAINRDVASEEEESGSDASLVSTDEEEEVEEVSALDEELSVPEVTPLDVGVTAVATANILLPQQLKCRGLPNLGNTCYINATLQCLFRGQSFCTQLRQQEEVVREGPSALLISSLVGVLGLRTSTDRELKMAVLLELKHLVSLRNRRFEGNSQNDAHEFLFECLLGLRVTGHDLGDVATQCPVDTLSFQLLNIRTCRSCGLESRGEESTTHISLPMVAQGSVRSCLERHFSAEQVEYRCECGGQESDKRTQFHTLPQVLILHLVRFCPFTLNKIEDALHLDTELQVMPRTEGTAVSAEEAASGHCSRAPSPGRLERCG
ncbi:ubiquitin carboxyl-terminal hydrolase 26-like [Engraulis encrasicolus]|uniref:ubiquitin carboxyl-terminal hydrolase 26-like n=1 Tax=Engraulis encrasicolus TaxID=184585 RepID=UPI002FD5CD71